MGLPLDLHDAPYLGTPDLSSATGSAERQDNFARQYLAEEFAGRQNASSKPAGADAPAVKLAINSDDKSDQLVDPTKSWEQKYEAVDAFIRDRYYPKDHLAATNFYQLEKKYSGNIKNEADYLQAIQAETKTLNDPWTEFTSTAEIQQNKQRSQDGFRSTGIWIKDKGGSPVIEALLYGFPAYHSDLRIGDKLLSVNGKSVAGLPIANIEPMLEGKQGQKINIQFETPEGDKRSQDLTVVDPEPMHSSAKITDDPKSGKKVLQLGLLSFDKDACDQLEDAIKAIPKDQLNAVSGIVLDLRGNEGGWLPPILRTADMFVPKGDFFRLDDRDGSNIIKTTGFDESDYTLDAPTRQLLRDLPLAVLINGTTRSAPETLTAGLRERGRPCAVVGDQSYGKAIAYDTADIPGGFLKVTIEELKTPKGFEWQGKGLKPDIEVANPRGANAEDIQLERAIDAVTANKK